MMWHSLYFLRLFFSLPYFLHYRRLLRRLLRGEDLWKTFWRRRKKKWKPLLRCDWLHWTRFTAVVPFHYDLSLLLLRERQHQISPVQVAEKNWTWRIVAWPWAEVVLYLTVIYFTGVSSPAHGPSSSHSSHSPHLYKVNSSKAVSATFCFKAALTNQTTHLIQGNL